MQEKKTIKKEEKNELIKPTKFMVLLADGDQPCIFFHLYGEIN